MQTILLKSDVLLLREKVSQISDVIGPLSSIKALALEIGCSTCHLQCSLVLPQGQAQLSHSGLFVHKLATGLLILACISDPSGC